MEFAPLFVVWGLWQGLFYLVAGDNAAGTFIYVVQRKQRSQNHEIPPRN